MQACARCIGVLRLWCVSRWCLRIGRPPLLAAQPSPARGPGRGCQEQQPFSRRGQNNGCTEEMGALSAAAPPPSQGHPAQHGDGSLQGPAAQRAHAAAYGRPVHALHGDHPGHGGLYPHAGGQGQQVAGRQVGRVGQGRGADGSGRLPFTFCGTPLDRVLDRNFIVLDRNAAGRGRPWVGGTPAAASESQSDAHACRPVVNGEAHTLCNYTRLCASTAGVRAPWQAPHPAALHPSAP